MSFELLEPAADALGELCESVVFLGGATIALWLTDPFLTTGRAAAETVARPALLLV